MEENEANTGKQKRDCAVPDKQRRSCLLSGASHVQAQFPWDWLKIIPMASQHLYLYLSSLEFSLLATKKFWLKHILHILPTLRRITWEDPVVSLLEDWLKVTRKSMSNGCCGCTGLLLSQGLREEINPTVSGRSMYWLSVQHHLERVFKDLSFKKKYQTLVSV